MQRKTCTEHCIHINIHVHKHNLNKNKTKDKYGHALIYLETLYFTDSKGRWEAKAKKPNEFIYSVANLYKFAKPIKNWKMNMHTHIHNWSLQSFSQDYALASQRRKKRTHEVKTNAHSGMSIAIVIDL